MTLFSSGGSHRSSVKNLLAAILCATFTATGFAAAPASNAVEKNVRTTQNIAMQNVARATLANGLRVVIVKNTLAPVVATSVNYLVGSDETPEGFPGTAHAQEHMMFRGSPGLSADQLAAIGSIMGGSFNANTREALTQYLYTVPAEDLSVALHIEALRMQAVFDAQADWDRERGAIEQEVAQDISSPEYLLYSRLRALLFAGTPYAHDALGTRPSFDATTAEMLKHFHDTWYAPNNAILVVVGNVDPAATLASIKEIFGAIKSKKLPARPAFKLQPIKATTISVDTDHPTGTQMIAMRLPGLNSEDFPALEVLADVLSSERFDLYGLVPQGKAISASFSLDPLPKASIGYASMSFAGSTDPKTLDHEARAILSKVAETGVPPELVAAAKTQERRAAEFQKNSIEGLASVWADAIALYGLHSPADDLVRIEKVTVADVNRVAKKYLDLDHAVSATMIPHGSGRPVAAGGGFGGKESIALGEASDTPLPSWAEAALTKLAVPTSTTHPLVSTLPNGLTLIVQPEDVSDTVTVLGHIKNRAETEEASGKEGVGAVLEQLFSYGSEKLGRLELQQALDKIGADEHAGLNFSVQTLRRDFVPAVAVLADNELHPALPPAAFTIVRNRFAQYVGARNTSPNHLTQRSLREALFPKEDPSLREATAQSVSALNLDDVRAYYHKAFRPDLTTIVVIGKISAAEARTTIEKYFGEWRAEGPKPNTELPPVPLSIASHVAVPDASRVQDNVVLAETLPMTRSNPDYYALQLGNAVLGGGFYASRMSVDLRKNAGLVYSAGSVMQAGVTRTIYFAEYACDPQNVSKASNIIVQELLDLQNKPVPPLELQRVKALLLRQIPLSEASIDGIAQTFIERRDMQLPLDESILAAHRIVDLNSADVQAAMKKWLRPKDLARVTQGPAPQ